MTIDDAIKCARERAEESRNMYVCLLETSYQYQMKHKEEMDNYKQSAEEHEQLADWLEELKKYKATNYPRCSECAGCTQWNCDCENVRNKAIDDFVNSVKKKFPDDRCGIMNIEIIATQLKAGGTNGNSTTDN